MTRARPPDRVDLGRGAGPHAAARRHERAAVRRQGGRLRDRDRARQAAVQVAPGEPPAISGHLATVPRAASGSRRAHAAPSGAFSAIPTRRRTTASRARAARGRVLPVGAARREAVRGRGRRRRDRPDRLHRRGDEAHEPGGAPTRPARSWRSASRTASRSSSSRCSCTSSRAPSSCRVREGPDRQPGRDRAARRTRLPRAGDPSRGRLLHGRRGLRSREVRRRVGLHRAAGGRAAATSTSRASSGRPRRPGPRRFTRATGSSPRTPTSPRSAPNEGITFIGPKPEVMEKVGDKAIARDLMPRAGLPLLPGTIEPVTTAGRGAGDRRRRSATR